MAQTKQSEVTINQILSGIDERIELLQTVKAAVRYAFTNAYEQDDTMAEAEAPTRPARAKRRSYRQRAAKGHNKALFIQALQSRDALSTDDVYEWLKAHDWHTTSSNPRYLVAVVLRNLTKTGHAMRTVDGRWALVQTQANTESGTAAQAA